MTKARARQRAKAKAAEKARKREANADSPDTQVRSGKFDPGPGSIKSPIANTRQFGRSNRGAARSR